MPVDVVDGNKMPVGVPGATQAVFTQLPEAFIVKGVHPVGLDTVMVPVSALVTTVGVYSIYIAVGDNVVLLEKL